MASNCLPLLELTYVLWLSNCLPLLELTYALWLSIVYLYWNLPMYYGFQLSTSTGTYLCIMDADKTRAAQAHYE